MAIYKHQCKLSWTTSGPSYCNTWPRTGNHSLRADPGGRAGLLRGGRSQGPAHGGPASPLRNGPGGRIAGEVMPDWEELEEEIVQARIAHMEEIPLA